MSEPRWRGNGPRFDLSWAGSAWQLRLDGPRPGLERTGSETCLTLALAGLSVRNRSVDWASERPRLARSECLFDRVEATYAFPAWGGLTVRAGWHLAADPVGVDLEIQVLADSVDLLKGVEVQVVTELSDPARSAVISPEIVSEVEPRDRESAGLSYDGREPPEILRRLMTLPVPSPSDARFAPIVVETPWLGGPERYIEFVHPDDAARRVVERSNPDRGITRIRYGLFGYDLEKGVLLRSRMRGLWRQGPVAADELASMFRDFRDGPLPLGP